MINNKLRGLVLISVIVISMFSMKRIDFGGLIFKLNPVKDEYSETSIKYESMSRNFIMKSEYEQKKEELLSEINNYNVETNILQEQVLSVVYEHCTGNNIEITNINFTEIIPVSLAEAPSEEILHETPGVYMCVTIEFKSTYGDMLFFIDDIKNDDMDIALTNMRTIAWEGDVIYGVVDMKFYALTLKM